MTPGRRRAAGHHTDARDAGNGGSPAGAAERLALGGVADVPPGALEAGLRLPLHAFLGLELVGLRPARVSAAVGERTRNLAGSLHGGAISTLVDVAANVAVATSGRVDVTRCGLATSRTEIDFHARPRGDRVCATAETLEVQRRTARSEITVCDAEGRRIATATVLTRVLPGGGFTATGLTEGAA